ncbi:724eb808-abc8-4021-8606-5148c2cead92 [Sclerotinia trifoliorum]|uniref:724eb808-abc8-4021-8606-5148c2cead92 n=1 Tax=Sclerotinia trifoliorum TaxID=28548 RepID=A0A8H2ZPJ7_9HELO|nr:724eb808-abc8-4021-8606-5148c2cead92 [Sclerotinia trifoliorum]
MLSYNFAYGGATTNASLVAPYAPTVLSLIDQVNQFVQYIPSGPWSASNTLFGIFMGVNDVGNAYYLSNYTTVLGQIMDSYFAEVQRLYDAGGRNFLFLSVPPTQDSPLFIAQGTAVQASLTTAISQYNAAIISRVTEFKAANAESKTWVYDTQIPFLAAINNPTAYGSADATCINADGVSCLWWNNYHPGQIIHKLVAQGVAALLKGTFW